MEITKEMQAIIDAKVEEGIAKAKAGEKAEAKAKEKSDKKAQIEAEENAEAEETGVISKEHCVWICDAHSPKNQLKRLLSVLSGETA